MNILEQQMPEISDEDIGQNDEKELSRSSGIDGGYNMPKHQPYQLLRLNKRMANYGQ